MSNLDGVLKYVLTIAGTVLKAADKLDKLMMQAMYAYLEYCLFAGLTNLGSPRGGPFQPFPQCGQGEYGRQ